ncbi:hypothetical protein Aduo_001694 [Ancylostoma duodenale]
MHKKAVDEGGKGELKGESNRDWLMESFTTAGRYYRLTVSECPCENTKMHCSLCGTCPVRVVCSCPDAVKFGVACKHAHAWALNHDQSVEVIHVGTDENMPQLEACADDYDTELHAPEADDRNEMECEDEVEHEVEVMDIDEEKQLAAMLQEYTDRLMFAVNSRRASGSMERRETLRWMQSNMRTMLARVTGGDSVQHHGATVPNGVGWC